MSGKQSSLNLSVFSLFNFIEMFQFSFNFESSERLFFFSKVHELNFIFLLILSRFNFLIISIESSVKLSFQQNSRGEFSFFSIVDFRLILLFWWGELLFEILISYSRSE